MNIINGLKTWGIALCLTVFCSTTLGSELYSSGNYILHPNKLYYGESLVYKGLYSQIWTKKSGSAKPRFNFVDAVRSEKTEDGKHIVVLQDEKNGVKGKQTIKVDPRGITFEFDIKVEPEVGTGEIGFYIPEEFIFGKDKSSVRVNVNEIKKSEITRDVKGSKIISQYKDGIMEIQGVNNVYLAVSGLGFKNSYGAHLQDFRKSNSQRDTFRYVISFNPKTGCDMSLKLRLSIDRRPIAAEYAAKKKNLTVDFKEREKLFVTNGDKVKLDMLFGAPEGHTINSQVTWKVIDESGKKVMSGEFEKEVEDGYVHPFKLDIKRNGAYRFEATIVGGEKTIRKEVLFSVFPKLLENAPQDGILGATGIQGVQRMKDLAEICGVKWHRRHCSESDTRYRRMINKGDNTLNIPYLRRAEKLEDDKGCIAMGSLFLGPKGKKKYDLYWEKDKDKYMDAWLNTYVIPLVKATKDRIRYWEVGNEPYYEFRKNPEVYVEILRRTHDAIKAIDPEIKIIGICGPPRSIGEQWYRDTFKLGALKYMDILSFHQYCFANNLISNPEKGFASWFDTLKGLLAEYGKPNMPIWNSETSVTPPATMYTLPKNLEKVRYLSGHKSPDPREQAAVTARVITMHYVYNIKYIFHLFGANSTYTCHPSEFDGSPCALAVSMAGMNRLLEGKKSQGDLKLNDRVKAYPFTNSDGVQTVALWLEQLYPNDKASIDLAPALQNNTVQDIFANTLDSNIKSIKIMPEPVYITFNESMSIEALRKSFKESNLNIKISAKIESIGDMKKAHKGDWVGYYPINLAPYVNRSFKDDKAGDTKGGFTDEGDNDLRRLTGGDFLGNGIPFRFVDEKKNNDKACIVLGGKIREYFPKQVMNIQVGEEGKGERLTQLHFLHMITNAYLARNKPIFTYTINYSDGTSTEIEAIEGKNIADWYSRKDLEEARAVLHMPNLHTDEVNLFHYKWSISHPNGWHARIVSIDIKSKGTGAIPVIVAITGVLSN